MLRFRGRQGLTLFWVAALFGTSNPSRESTVPPAKYPIPK
jgi:hypothetical protein